MIVVSSRYEVDIPQIDGRCYVTEWHTQDTGEVFRRDYGPVDVGQLDLQAIADNFARQMEADAGAV